MTDFHFSRRLETEAQELAKDGKHFHAEDKLWRALELAEDEDNPERMVSLLVQLSDALSAQGIYFKARRCLQDARDWTNQFADQRMSKFTQVVVLEKLSRCLFQLNKLDKAVQAARASLLLCTVLSGRETKERLSKLILLSECLEKQGNWPLALVFRHEVARLIATTELFAEDPRWRAHQIGSLAICLNTLEKYREAEARFREAVKLACEKLGEDDQFTQFLSGRLADNLCAQGRFAEAEPWYFALAVSKWNQLGEWGEASFHAYWHLAQCLAAQGKYAEAEPLYRNLIEVNAYLYPRADQGYTPEAAQLASEHEGVVVALAESVVDAPSGADQVKAG